MFFRVIREEELDTFKRFWTLGDIRAQTIPSLNLLMSHQADQKVFEAVSERVSEKSLF